MLRMGILISHVPFKSFPTPDFRGAPVLTMNLQIEDGLDFVAAWAPPQFDTSNRPSLSTKLELEPDTAFSENFVRTAKWYVTV